MRPDNVHVRVVYGWWYRFGSGGLVRFAQRLRSMGYNVLDDLPYHQADRIAYALDLASTKYARTAIIGFSMGGNTVSWVSNRVKRDVDLGVAYDPSVGMGPIRAHQETVSPKIKRCLSYQGNGIPAGGALLTGPTVENYYVGRWHLVMDCDESLHQLTLKALENL